MMDPQKETITWNETLYRGKFSDANIFVQRKVLTCRTEFILVHSCSQTMLASDV